MLPARLPALPLKLFAIPVLALSQAGDVYTDAAPGAALVHSAAKSAAI